MILDTIVEATKPRVDALYQQKPLNQWREEALKNKTKSFRFYKAIEESKFAVIAEIKKASPSKGVIDPVFDYKQISKEYKEANADCISVLTEPFFFQGKNEYIKEVRKISGKPVIRKDFIIDEIQIYESKLLGADCILLIARILTEEQLKSYLDTAHELGLSVLVETHSKEEIETALRVKARMIGVNNRNLQTFEVDLNHSIKLRKLVPEDILFISESGIFTKQDTTLLRRNNINGVLIGESFMRSHQKAQLMKEFKDE